MNIALDKQKYQLYTAKSRPDLWKQFEDDRHPLNAAWPLFLDQDACYQKYAKGLAEYEGLAEYQFAIVERNHEDETMVACGRSIPFYFPELDDKKFTKEEALHCLPEGGYDAILTRGIEQYRRRLSPKTATATPIHKNNHYFDAACSQTNPPNALSAISITVRPDRRSLGLAEAMIQAMKQTAINKNLDILVVPLRPTRKSEFPSVDMADYITWPQLPATPDRVLPFDPWLRKHIRLGGRIIKVAPTSMRVEGRIADWQHWTRCDEWRTLPGKCDSDLLYVEVQFPGGLVPLCVFVEEDRAVYIEPNVWLYHDLQRTTA
ncbi:hypothetical protein N7536_011178 [Penicillium majusculum]|uniref:Uncharacterized protein n=1 Tax=Penicillium solitum TaxID=60172 RepID=A0A1V6QS57_9EURO|nr:uncharacterized protein PENSOL_c049G05062 [Penicillium solitum]KAJ5680039.1 hypothetical protein N7536_011178 [Penicillium majusculum]OQD91766.1 hypothetical protein PENSOL_c049G05062 [Penicillium solitum]